ncbi:HlyD family secretion protein [Geopseudomonas sagittaria]|uniref:HlyD family secretion protein n=1 Tax=Geopseudomonas sagittaria TaxID=1135990 RepID=A0A1I5S0N2_9GAMM|nr:efflux RND transporter periplasmic adaptor subunit [Pseudomonas sagittaria]SFP64292.1 HlyD family secretion protein [Pseudomonas sagittaria]
MSPAALRLRPALLLVLLPLALLAYLAWRHWQGPLLPAYQLELRPLVQRVVASGEVSSQSLARIGSELTGVIKARHVREGDAVQPGDLLLELHDAEQQARLREAEAALRQLTDSSRPQALAALREAQSNLDQASRERQRREALFARQLLSAEAREQARRAEVTAREARARAELAAAALASGGSEEQVLRQRLEQARATLAKTRIHAQLEGTVQTRNVEPGDLVRPGDTLLEIARAGSREILLPLDEKNLAPVALGQRARIVADAWPERVLDARVSYIAPAVDTARGTVDVHLDLDAPADFLRQGMTVSVNIDTARRERALVIANDALRRIDGSRAEVLREQGGRVEAVPVRLGLRSIALSEVLDGLQEGDRVLAADAQAGQRVRLNLQPLPSGVAE